MAYYELDLLIFLFLSSANKVSTGPTYLYVQCAMYGLFDILASDSDSGTLLIQQGVLNLAEQCHTQSFISNVSSRILMPQKTNLVYSSRRLRWQPQTVPHSDRLAWLNSATLKILSQMFQVGF